MGKNILHLIYCVPKLHFHHAATYEGWTSVSATVATVSWSWVWQILSPQAGSWWWLGLSPTFWIHWRSIAALEALSMLDDITFGWWWTGTNSQSSTSKALTWIRCKLFEKFENLPQYQARPNSTISIHISDLKNLRWFGFFGNGGKFWGEAVCGWKKEPIPEIITSSSPKST